MQPERCTFQPLLTHLLASPTSISTLWLFSRKFWKVNRKKTMTNSETWWKRTQIWRRVTFGRFQFLKNVWPRRLNTCLILYWSTSLSAWPYTGKEEQTRMSIHTSIPTPTSQRSLPIETKPSSWALRSPISSKVTSLRWSKRTKKLTSQAQTKKNLRKRAVEIRRPINLTMVRNLIRLQLISQTKAKHPQLETLSKLWMKLKEKMQLKPF